MTPIKLRRIKYTNDVIDFTSQSFEELSQLIKAKFIRVKSEEDEAILSTDLISTITQVNNRCLEENDLVKYSEL